MLLRELVIDENVLTLKDVGDSYIIELKNKDCENLFFHEYSDYEEIREVMDLIVKEYEEEIITIARLLDILKDSKN
ncbi:MAG: hypothetical protein M0P77_09435 [Firmicutes bacterium]|nr:hypothetical protein [Bacillota bacterium]